MGTDGSYRELPNIFGGDCFACSPNNTNGLQMRFKTNGQGIVTCSLSVPERFCGWQRFIHGGIISTILDEVMSWTVIHQLKCLVMTKSITIEYHKPLVVTEPIRAEGRILSSAQKHEATVEGLIYNVDEDICVAAKGVFARFSPRIGKRIGVIDDDADPKLESFLKGEK